MLKNDFLKDILVAIEQFDELTARTKISGVNAFYQKLILGGEDVVTLIGALNNVYKTLGRQKTRELVDDMTRLGIVNPDKYLTDEKPKLKENGLLLDFPKCGRPFLAKFKSYPWYTLCAYNKSAGNVVMCEFNISTYEGEDDPYFENDWVKEEEITSWIEIP